MLYTLVEPHRGHAGGLQPLVRAGPLLRRLPDRRLQLRRGPLRGHRPAEGAALPARARAGPWWPIRRSAATSASTTCSTAITTSGTGGPSTRSTPCTPPAGCSSSGTTSTPASTASSGSTAATPTGCRPSSPSTTGSPGMVSVFLEPADGVDRRRRSAPGTASEYLPSVLPGSPVATVLGFSPLPLLADAPGDVPRGEAARRAGAGSLLPRRGPRRLAGRRSSPPGGRPLAEAGLGHGHLGLPVHRHRARHRHLHRPAVVGQSTGRRHEPDFHRRASKSAGRRPGDGSGARPCGS